jgi:hypothetical protein
MREYFYTLLCRYIGFFILSDSKVTIILPDSADHIAKTVWPFKEGQFTFMHLERAQKLEENDWKTLGDSNPDYIVMFDHFHFESDIYEFLNKLRGNVGPRTKLIFLYYSSLWRPVIKCAEFFGIAKKAKPYNWITESDITNFLGVTGWEVVSTSQRIICPAYIPLISEFLNRWIAPMPIFNIFSMANLTVAKKSQDQVSTQKPSVSVVVAARNEEGNLRDLINRLPQMGPNDELIFVEGNSTDKTWDEIQKLVQEFSPEMNILCIQQDGKGKGDAVRKGFDLASKEILMILDADMTVPPEDLPKFYEVLSNGHANFVNGSRLVYPMEAKAMRFFNLLGNKFFAMGFSFLLGQRLKDTLCGTKVMLREDYKKLQANRKYFGDFDPFGDFDLLFGASRLSLKIVELPVRYRERIYGETNISRWTHGLILLRMLIFASKRIKFI